MKPTITAVNEAYIKLDDARAKLEQLQCDLQVMDEPDLQDKLLELRDEIENWLEGMHLISEGMLDWTGHQTV
jgi:hypothetical protein|tara:strand:+ start:452 stop:667 length:216 start_codon:yes stop_codon:yes gene_type:complete